MIVDCATHRGGRRVAAPVDLSDALWQARGCGDPSAFLDMRRISAWAAISAVPR